MGVVGGTRSHRESHTNNKKILPPQGSNLRLDAVRRDREKAGGGGWHMTPPSEIAFLFLFFYSYYYFFLEQSWVLRCTPGDFLGRVDFFFFFLVRERQMEYEIFHGEIGRIHIRFFFSFFSFLFFSSKNKMVVCC